ncbi:MAG: zinc ABC transporter substrate-binding protein [Microcella sp.]|uniref:metal ABC transporter substrate-binding protein n=1 Tax=Microcella sp. TaxID=1913979 RepID=UPI0024C7D2ED|nr:metal ABC transporter substrate-binding protein [Microcella sp.]UYN83017.1 MAG: zinc ABC transporter substrate-binding protein [Microcella sp.]
MTHRIPAAAALVAGSALALALTGCASPEAPAAEGLSIVATTTQVADFTQQIAGDAAQVTSLIQPNQSSHSFDPTAADLAALATADVLVINGAGLEEWLENAVEASGFSGTTIDASSGVALREFDDDHAHDDDDHADDHAHDDHSHDDHAHDDHSHDDHAHDDHADDHAHDDDDHSDEHDHAHEGDDPHIWTSVGNAIAMVEAIAAGLADVDAESAEAFDANAQAYIAQLEALDAWIIENIEQIDPSERLLVTNHEAFGYFVDAYDVTYVGAVIPSFDDNAEVSAADIDALVSAIRSSGATAVFSETTLSPAAAETIAAEARVDVFSGSDGLYGDSLGPVGSTGETYIGSMIHNVTVLVQAWGGSVTPVPAELSQ